ncbi:MAG: rhodanese-like domain-containing protein [Reyranellaceae bacterium]
MSISIPIDVKELARLTASGEELALFDVREAGEGEDGHIPGATMLPRRQIELRIPDLVQRRDTPIVVCDDGGDRAALAAATLSGLGYGNVSVLAGGTAAWSAAGRPLETGSNTPSKRFAEHLAEEGAAPEVDCEKLEEWRRSGLAPLLLDIRPSDENAQARIPGAWSAPSFDYVALAPALMQVGVPVVTHCAGRTRSLMAAATLRLLGVPRAMALQDGTLGWMLSGRELETGAGNGRLELQPDAAQGEALAANLAGALEAVRPIEAEELAALLAERARGRRNAYVFDVRPLSESEKARPVGALALPGGQAVQRIDDFAPVRGAPIVLIDAQEGQAHVTAYWLARLGYGDIRVLKGGMRAWEAHGLPLSAGRGRSQPLGLDAATTAASPMAVEDAATALARPSPPLVIDVDSSRSFAAAHLPGARWMPRGWLEDRVRDLPKNTALLVTCGTGLHSAYAAATLRGLGFVRARSLAGGVAAWRAAGHKTERGAAPDADRVRDILLPPSARGREGMLAYLQWERKLTAT